MGSFEGLADGRRDPSSLRHLVAVLSGPPADGLELLLGDGSSNDLLAHYLLAHHPFDLTDFMASIDESVQLATQPGSVLWAQVDLVVVLVDAEAHCLDVAIGSVEIVDEEGSGHGGHLAKIPSRVPPLFDPLRFWGT